MIMFSSVGVVLLLAAAFLGAVLTPIAIGIVMAYVFEPVLGWLERHRVRRCVGVAAIYAVLLGLLAAGVITLGPKLISQTAGLYRYLSNTAQEYGGVILGSEAMAGGEEEVSMAELLKPKSVAEMEQEVSRSEAKKAEQQQSAVGTESVGEDAHLSALVQRVRTYLKENADRVATRVGILFMALVRKAFEGITSVFGFLFNCLLVIVFAFFFMLNYPRMLSTVKRYIPAKHKKDTMRILRRIDVAVSNFFRGRLLVCVFAGVVCSIGLRLSGIDYWLLIGLSAGFLGFIPIIGVIVPLIPSCAFALLTAHPWGSLLGVAITFTVVQTVVEPLVGTVVLSHEVKLHPVIIIMSLLIGGQLLGVFGVLAAVPVAAVIRILGEEFLLPPLREMAEE